MTSEQKGGGGSRNGQNLRSNSRYVADKEEGVGQNIQKWTSYMEVAFLARQDWPIFQVGGGGDGAFTMKEFISEGRRHRVVASLSGSTKKRWCISYFELGKRSP